MSEITGIRNNQGRADLHKIIIRENNIIHTLFCRISLKYLVDLYHEFQPNPEKIFESNVRGLQNDKKVKNDMLNSLSSNTKAREFYKLHNGITIVAESIEAVHSTGFIIKDPQIVNGCQTVTNIAEEFINDRQSTKLTNGSVLCKIFSTTHAKLEEICQASNTQTAIKLWDLRTNDEIQIKLESFLNINGIQYNRKAKNSTTLTFVELGQWLYACLKSDPAGAKNKKRLIFDISSGSNSIYYQIFNDKLDFEDVLYIIKNGIFLKKKIKNLSNKTFEKPADLHFLSSFYKLREKNWNPDYKFRRIKPRIRETVTFMHNQFGDDLSYISMFTRKEETWNHLSEIINNELL